MAEPKKKKAFKLDLWGLLKQIDNRNFKYYQQMSAEEQKAFTGLVAMRWVSEVQGDYNTKDYYLQAVNEMVNKHFWDISKHPELQYMTLAACGLGGQMRHTWIKGPGKKNENKVFKFLKQYYPLANDEELSYFLKINTMDDFIEMAEMMGYQKEQIAELKKELKKVCQT